MQKSYVVKRAVYFQPGEVYFRAGDILVHDPANANKLTIYRNQAIVAVTTHTAAGLASMANRKPVAWIEEIHNEVAAEVEATEEAKVEILTEEIPTPSVDPVAEPTEEEIPATSGEPAFEETSKEEILEPEVLTEDSPLVLADLKKADIVSHAKEVHGLELDPSLKKPELIAAIEEHIEKTKTEVSQ